MKIVLTNHAQQRMKEREVRLADVQSVVAEPGYKKKVFKKKYLASRKFGKEKLTVVYMKKKNLFVTITVYYEN